MSDHGENKALTEAIENLPVTVRLYISKIHNELEGIRDLHAADRMLVESVLPERDSLRVQVHQLRIALEAMNHPTQNYIPALDCTVDELLEKHPNVSANEIQAESLINYAYDRGWGTVGDSMTFLSDIVKYAQKLQRKK